MPATLTLTHPPERGIAGPEQRVSARLAHWAAPGQPPRVHELAAADAGVLIEDLLVAVAALTGLPVLAVREVVENLVHADFAGALVSVLDEGRTVRVTDAGPGVADPLRALQPGFSAAGPRARRLVRGVGGGLPLAADLLAAVGGRLEIAGNLGGGAAVTLSAPVDPPPATDPLPSELERTALALLLELGSAGPARVAHELGRELPECGRCLTVLEHRGLAARDPGGARRLTPTGEALVATLF